MSGRRVETAGIARSGRAVSFTFEGEPVEGIAGESLAAALTAGGHMAWRGTKAGGHRGLFCGMGVCQDCLVQVDGHPAERACLTPVAEGLAVRRQPYAVDLAAASPERAFAARELAPDLLVIGGGPAGLAAAKAAASAGASVVLVDERAKLGGQYFKPLADSHRFTKSATDRQFAEGRALIDEVELLPVILILDALVWGAFAVDEVGVVAGGTSWLIRARRLVLATGAYERAVPLPGWTLPGAMTTGAAQTLLRAYRVSPGSKILVAGNGPLNLQVAAELVRAGVEVVALAEAAAPPWTRPAAALAMLRAAPDLVRDGLRDLACLRRAGVPVLYRHKLVAIEGEGQVAAGRLAGPGGERRFAADAVLMGHGFEPQSELARALGCRHDHDPRFDQLRARRDAEGRSSVPEIFIAGDGGGLGGARVALAQGTLAGAAAARDLGHEADAAVVRRARAALARHRRFQDALWRLHAAPPPGHASAHALAHALATPETPICRCEEVSRATLEAAIAEGCASIGALKRRTRAGMGRCQGRYCAPVMVAMLAEATGRPIDEWVFMAPRAPTRPVPIAAIAALSAIDEADERLSV